MMAFQQFITLAEAGYSASPDETRCAPPGTPLSEMRNFTLKCQRHGFRVDLCPWCGVDVPKQTKKRYRIAHSGTPGKKLSGCAVRKQARAAVLRALADGAKNLSEVSARTGLPFSRVATVATGCRRDHLIEWKTGSTSISDAGRRWLDDLNK